MPVLQVSAGEEEGLKALKEEQEEEDEEEK